MKKIILIILLFTSFLSASINEYLSDVYFANGIDTKKEDADDSLRIINKKFKLSNPEAYKYVNDWNVSYNHTHGIGIDWTKLRHSDEQTDRYSWRTRTL